MTMPTTPGSLARPLAWACALLLGGAAAAAEAPAPKPANDGAIDPEAIAIVNRAGDFLRDAKRFRFSAETGYEVVQADGSRLEFGATRRDFVQRPDRLRVETEPRDGDQKLTVFDGKSLVQVDVDEKIYARANLKTPRDIDFMIDVVRERLDASLPLGELLRNNPREAIEDSLELAAIVGSERLRGVACDHLALRNPDVDLQLWIARGDQPLVRRVVITYLHEAEQPSFWADLDEWTFPAEFADATFQYTPPAGAERVRFDVRAKPTPAPSPEAAR